MNELWTFYQKLLSLSICRTDTDTSVFNILCASTHFSRTCETQVLDFINNMISYSKISLIKHDTPWAIAPTRPPCSHFALLNNFDLLCPSWKLFHILPFPTSNPSCFMRQVCSWSFVFCFWDPRYATGLDASFLCSPSWNTIQELHKMHHSPLNITRKRVGPAPSLVS